MDIEYRLQMLSDQKGAYMEGTIEQIDSNWFFYDDINESTYRLDELDEVIEIFLNGKWIKGKHTKQGLLIQKKGIVLYEDGYEARIKKRLTLAFEEWIGELSDPVFLLFVKSLNELSYSIYESIYCHNFLSFLQTRAVQKGTNTIIFDNGEQICTVHHHFERSITIRKDRFEFTLSDGSRTLLQNIS